MFQNFPYSDMHQLNLDWIIKIAKDFLDQYTSIQTLIETGITDIGNKTTEGLADLEAEKNRLEGLLNDWYTTHSNDIANELTAALASIGTTLSAAIADFNTAAQAKADQTIASIPSDYTTLANDVALIADEMKYFMQFYTIINNRNLVNSNFIEIGEWINTSYQVVSEANSKRLILPVVGGSIISMCLGIDVYLALSNIGGIIVYDAEGNDIQHYNVGEHRSGNTYQGYGIANFKLPDNAAMFSVTIKLASTWDATSTMIIKYGSDFDDYTGDGNVISQLKQFKLADDTLRNAITTESFSEVILTTTAKKLLQASGAVIDYDNAEYVISNHIPVKDCDSVKVTGNNTFANGIAAFYDDNGIVISVPLVAAAGSARTYITDRIITVPAQAAYMILSGASHTPPECEKLLLKLEEKQASPLYNKMVTVIGDSITEHNTSATYNWVDYMEDKTGCIIQNLGQSGIGFYRNNPYINKIPSINSNTDIIGVAISFNDVGYLPIGTYTDTGTETLCGWARDFFTALQTAFPATPVICYSQGPWANLHNYGPLASGTAFINEIKKVCNSLGIPCYDELYMNGSALRPWNADNQEVYYKNDTTQLVDPTHPNSNGHKVIANYLIPKFEQNIANI